VAVIFSVTEATTSLVLYVTVFLLLLTTVACERSLLASYSSMQACLFHYSYLPEAEPAVHQSDTPPTHSLLFSGVAYVPCLIVPYVRWLLVQLGHLRLCSLEVGGQQLVAVA
jgi:hypothetical protein